jgi:selenocysteine-specific elongation factor
VRAEFADELLGSLVDDGRALVLQRPLAYVDADAAHALFARVCERLASGEREAPWSAGVTALPLSRALALPEPQLARVLAAFVEDGRIAYRSGYYATPGYAPKLTAEQSAFFERLFVRDPAAPTAPFSLAAARTALGASKIAGAAVAFETLLASGALVRIDDAVYRGEQIAEIRARLEAALRKDKQITVSAFRELAGTSRKFAVPLIEWFDAAGITMRAGDVRVLRRTRDQ